MSDTSRRQAIRNVIGVALASTSSVSLIVSALAEGLDEVTVKTTDGREIKFTADASVATIVSGGKIVDPNPSGTFRLANGQSIVLADGLVVDGTAAARKGDWAAFALAPKRKKKAVH
jgi:hypothetical protein